MRENLKKSFSCLKTAGCIGLLLVVVATGCAKNVRVNDPSDPHKKSNIEGYDYFRFANLGNVAGYSEYLL